MAQVLVVDDDVLMRTLLAATLEREGHGVLLAANGREAMRLCHEIPVHVVLTDMMMPSMDGLQLIAALKESKPELPIIAMSGGSTNSQSYLQKAQELGAAHAFEKPFKIPVLLNALNEVLHRIKAQHR